MAIAPGSIGFQEIASSPAAPPVGFLILYAKTDNILYIKDSGGVEVPIGSASAITALTGEVTATGPGSAVATVSNAAVIGKVLTGFTAGPNSTVLATDTVLQAFQKLQAQVSGTTGTAITSLTGDVTATGPGAAAATVVSVGGKTAAQISTSVNDTLAATASNTASTIVKRDASGNFAASTITANLSGNATTSTTSTNFSGSLSGDVTGTQSATVVALVGGASAASVATSVADTQAATSVNTPNTIVKRDGSGNFAAGTITANLTGTATNATTAVNFSGSLSGDVTGTQTTTAISSPTVTGKLLTGYTVGSNTPISATDSILLAFEKVQGQINGTTGAAITSLTGDVTATGPGAAAATVVSVGGASAASIATSVSDTQAATSSNTPNTIVKRNGSGNFSAGVITANLTGNVTGNVSGTASNVTGIVAIANGGTNSSTALNNNRVMISSGGAIVENAAITGNRALASDASGIPVASATTDTELGFVSGVTSSIQTQLNGKQATGNYITALTGDATATGPGSVPITLATVNGNVGTFGSSTSIPTITVNAKGLITAASGNAVIAPAGTLTGTTLASNVVSSSLTSVGTITSGTWNGTTIAIANGGTGQTTANAAFNALSPMTTAGDIIYENATPVAARLPIGATGNVLTVSGGLPVWSAPATNGTVTSVALALPSIFTVSGSPVTTSGTLTGTLNTQTANTVFAGPTTGGAATPTFRALVSADIPAINLATTGNGGVTGVLPIANGGTNSSAALNNNRIMVSSGGAIVEAAALTNGQLLIGSTGAAPVAAAITAGSGISVTNAAGSITIATTGLAATTTKTANYTILSTDNIIFCDTSGGAFTLTLPSPTALAGKIYRIIDTTGNFQANNLTLARSSTEKIEGLAASKVLQTNWGWFDVTTNGTDWFVG